MGARFKQRGVIIGALAALVGGVFAGVTFGGGLNRVDDGRAASEQTSSQRASAPSPGRDAVGPSRTRLTGIALATAAENGEKSATDATAYETTRGDANARTSGAIVDSNQPVFLIVEHGNFVGRDVPLMYGSQPPRGHIITVIVDSVTGDITDWGYEPTEPRVKGLAIAARLVP